MPCAIRNFRIARLLAFVCCCCGIGAGAPGVLRAERRPAAEILARLDDILQPARSYRTDLAVAEFRQGKLEREATFQLYARKTPRGFDALAFCLTPPPDRNKVFLARDEKLWFYDPRSARPVPISPHQFRSHQLVLDLISRPLAAKYSAEDEGEEQISDLARRQVKAVKLALTSRERAKTGAPGLRYWLDRENNRPIKSEVLGVSGKPIRTVFYTEFKNVLSEQRSTRLVVLNPAESAVTELKFSSFSYLDLSDSLFDESTLPAAPTLLKQALMRPAP